MRVAGNKRKGGATDHITPGKLADLLSAAMPSNIPERVVAYLYGRLERIETRDGIELKMTLDRVELSRLRSGTSWIVGAVQAEIGGGDSVVRTASSAG